MLTELITDDERVVRLATVIEKLRERSRSGAEGVAYWHDSFRDTLALALREDGYRVARAVRGRDETLPGLAEAADVGRCVGVGVKSARLTVAGVPRLLGTGGGDGAQTDEDRQYRWWHAGGNVVADEIFHVTWVRFLVKVYRPE
jgi:hypothetical protein